MIVHHGRRSATNRSTTGSKGESPALLATRERRPRSASALGAATEGRTLKLSALFGGCRREAGGSVAASTRVVPVQDAVLGNHREAVARAARAAAARADLLVLSFVRIHISRQLRRGPRGGVGSALLERVADFRGTAAGTGGPGGDETRPGNRQGYSELASAGSAAADSRIQHRIRNTAGEHSRRRLLRCDSSAGGDAGRGSHLVRGRRRRRRKHSGGHADGNFPGEFAHAGHQRRSSWANRGGTESLCLL